MKKDNKGFSLVELIVVVLIMAILAVALTPQVMKWVNNSRVSADVQTQNSIVASIQIALTNSSALTDAETIKHTITVNKNSATTISPDGAFKNELVKNLDQPLDQIHAKSTNSFTIEVEKDATSGTVKVKTTTFDTSYSD